MPASYLSIIVAEVDLVKQGLKLLGITQLFIPFCSVAEVDLVKQGLKQILKHISSLLTFFLLQKSI